MGMPNIRVFLLYFNTLTTDGFMGKWATITSFHCVVEAHGRNWKIKSHVRVSARLVYDSGDGSAAGYVWSEPIVLHKSRRCTVSHTLLITLHGGVRILCACSKQCSVVPVGCRLCFCSGRWVSITKFQVTRVNTVIGLLVTKGTCRPGMGIYRVERRSHQRFVSQASAVGGIARLQRSSLYPKQCPQVDMCRLWFSVRRKRCVVPSDLL